MLDVNVYEVDWERAKLMRHISAEMARWDRR